LEIKNHFLLLIVLRKFEKYVENYHICAILREQVPIPWFKRALAGTPTVFQSGKQFLYVSLLMVLSGSSSEPFFLRENKAKTSVPRHFVTSVASFGESSKATGKARFGAGALQKTGLALLAIEAQTAIWAR